MKPKVGVIYGGCVLAWDHREPELLTAAEAQRLAAQLLIAALHAQEQEERQLLLSLKPVGEA